MKYSSLALAALGGPVASFGKPGTDGTFSSFG